MCEATLATAFLNNATAKTYNKENNQLRAEWKNNDSSITLRWEGLPASLSLEMNQMLNLLTRPIITQTLVDSALNRIAINPEVRVITAARMGLFGQDHPCNRHPGMSFIPCKTGMGTGCIFRNPRPAIQLSANSGG